jgi:hypothetical protein
MRLAAFSMIAFAIAAGPAFAGPAADMAKAHIDAVAEGDLAGILTGYADTAALAWVGGPLDGTYASPAALRDVWTKFAHAQGPQALTVASITEAANPKGATVTADIALAGKATVKVRYVLVYRGDKLVNEIWQVNPNASY